MPFVSLFDISFLLLFVNVRHVRSLAGLPAPICLHLAERLGAQGSDEQCAIGIEPKRIGHVLVLIPVRLGEGEFPFAFARRHAWLVRA